MSPNPALAKTHSAIRRLTISGLVAAVLMVGGAGGLSLAIEIAGAVIASGTVVVQSSVMNVQHPVGGTVADIAITEGARVKAGDVLITLDGTQARAGLSIITHSLDELKVRRARLMAERDGSPAMAVPEDILARTGTDPQIAELVASEQALFALRAATIVNQQEQLSRQIEQFTFTIEGLEHQDSGRQREFELVGAELEGLRGLLAKGLIENSRVSAMERDLATLEAEIGRIQSSIASTRGQIAETRMQSLGLVEKLRSEAAAELNEVSAKIAELEERALATTDELNRLEIRAPVDGAVHELAIHTVGGVVAAGQVIMRIVPEQDEVAIDAKVMPTAIDQLVPGQLVKLRIAAFNRRTAPEISGTVERIAADATLDERTGLSYFTVRIRLSPDQVALLGNDRLLPGMMVEAHVQTGSRTIAAYLLEPLTEQIAHAFRER